MFGDGLRGLFLGQSSDSPTRQTNEGFIRRTIKPALGHLQVRKVRGPILDQLYAQLKRCGDLACTGRPFTEHRNVPVLAINPRDPRPGWKQVTETLTEAIRSGSLTAGDELPSITELSALQGIGTGVIRPSAGGRRAGLCVGSAKPQADHGRTPCSPLMCFRFFRWEAILEMSGANGS